MGVFIFLFFFVLSQTSNMSSVSTVGLLSTVVFIAKFLAVSSHLLCMLLLLEAMTMVNFLVFVLLMCYLSFPLLNFMLLICVNVCAAVMGVSLLVFFSRMKSKESITLNF